MFNHDVSSLPTQNEALIVRDNASNPATYGFLAGKKIRVLFDFDHTIVDGNSDVFVFEKLAPDIVKEQKTLPKEVQWTDFMDLAFTKLHERKVTKEQIIDCFKDIPLAPEMSESLRYIADRGCRMDIVSDANTIFIDSILMHYRLRNLFFKVTTNPSFFDSAGKLHIVRFIKKTDKPHGCTLCPINMCKGEFVLDRLANERLFYVGDGSNDLCPVLRLKEGDQVFARAGFGLVKRLANPEYSKQVKAIVHLWATYEELRNLLKTQIK